MIKRYNMEQARKKCEEFFAPNYVIVDRIKAYLQEDEYDTVFQEDVAVVLGIPHNTLSILKSRGSQSFLPFVIKWCLENGLDIAKFTEQENTIKEQK